MSTTIPQLLSFSPLPHQLLQRSAFNLVCLFHHTLNQRYVIQSSLNSCVHFNDFAVLVCWYCSALNFRSQY